MYKWAFTIAKNEDYHFTMFFSGKIPRGIVIRILKIIAIIGTGAVAVVEIAKQAY
jgi:hypothetical protein